MTRLELRTTGLGNPSPLRRSLLVLAAITLAGASLVAAPRVAYAACDENTKFVQQVAGTNLYYENEDASIFYDNRQMCGGVNRQSTFMRMSDDYRSWLEIGTSEDPDGTTHFWSEWRSYPNPTSVRYYDLSGRPSLGQWYSFRIQNGGSGVYSLYWEPGSDPYVSSWQFLDNSAAMPRNVGEDESEEARFGDNPANHLAYKLSTQNRQYGGWGLWTNLQCDQSQNSIHDWFAEKKSNSYWDMIPSGSGIC